ncbi:MAG TPA: hypothetical protein VGJ27_01700 [Gaiellaceae bacterium]
MAGAGSVAGTGAVVRDLELEVVLPVAHDHSRPGRPGVLERVRKRRLHDPVRREIDAGRQLGRGTFEHDLDGQARGFHLGEEGVELRKARLRRERELVVARSQHPEQAAHLLERLVACALDHGERFLRFGRLGLEDFLAAARLEDHHADRVRDDVVELAGDP